MSDNEGPRKPHTGTRILTHGANGWKRGCRCSVCEAASGPHSGKRGNKPARLQGEDRRTRRASVPLSPRELALVDQARGEMPLGRYMRMLVLEGAAAGLGLDPDDVQPAGREAPRRPNYSKRQAGGGMAAKEEGHQS